MVAYDACTAKETATCVTNCRGVGKVVGGENVHILQSPLWKVHTKSPENV